MSTEGLRQKEIESRAADWILQLDRGEASPEDRAALEAWLAVDSRHREAYLKLDEAWRLSAGLKTWRPAGGTIDFHVLSSKPTPPQSSALSTRTWTWALAASVLLVVTVSFFLWLSPKSSATYTTSIGGYQRVVLEDGSVVQLNTDTQLRVQLDDRTRDIQLLRGEAYFDVAPDPQRPFSVRAGDTKVKVLGTQFTVRRKSSGAEVTVTQGKVAVMHANDAPVLVAGQTADVEKSEIKVARLQDDDLDRRLAWQAGQLRFKKQPLIEVIAEFNRYNRRRLEIEDPRLANVEVGGNFKANDLQSFLAAMHSALGIEAEEADGVIRLK